MDTLAQDLRYALRSLSRAPGFTLVAVLTLALGIGATTVIFSLVNALLLRPLPVDRPETLVTFQEFRRSGSDQINGATALSLPRYRDFREASTAIFSGFAAQGIGDLALSTGTEAEVAMAAYASGNYFAVLGLRPAAGRFFTDEEDRPGAAPVAVIAEHLWQTRFGGDPAVIGKTVRLNSHPVTVVGVAPAGFGGTFVGMQADLWVPTALNARLNPGVDDERRGAHIWLSPVARLRPGVTPERAESALRVIAGQVGPENDRPSVLESVRLHRVTGIPAGMRGAVQGFLAMLLATAVLVLLIAGTNVAAMLLARAMARHHEVAIRLAIGAARGRLVRQFLTESLLLFLLAGGAGVLLASWLTGAIQAFQPPVPVRVVLDLGIDLRVLGFALALALGAGVLFGLAPALQASRPDLVSSLKDAAGRGGGLRSRLRSAFVVAQIAMSFLLLVTAGLFVRALQSALDTDLGLDPDGVVVAALDLEPHGYDAERGRAFHATLRERVEALPGVEAVGLAQFPVLSGNMMRTDASRADEPAPENGRGVDYGVVDGGYFATMRIRAVEGRVFGPGDREGAPPVAVVNESLARRTWPGESAVGKLLRVGREVREVVGVVRDGKYVSVDEEATPYFYLPFSQYYSGQMTLHVRARGEPGPVLAALRREALAVDPNIPVRQPMPLSSLIGFSLFPQRMAAVLVGAFGVLGLVLAGIGVYGVLAFMVGQRTREIGVRLALGARTADVLRPVLRRGLALAAMGSGVGLLLALAATRLLSSLLFGVSATDPVTFVAVPVLLVGVGLLASYLPARRAARTDPMAALRAE